VWNRWRYSGELVEVQCGTGGGIVGNRWRYSAEVVEV